MTEVLAGKRVLVLEDEPLIAMVLVDILEEAGCTVVGPAHDADQAAKLIAESEIDVAVLDVNLGSGHTSASIADCLEGLWHALHLCHRLRRDGAAQLRPRSAARRQAVLRADHPRHRCRCAESGGLAQVRSVYSSTRLWVSGTKKMPMTTVAAAMTTGYQSPK